MAKRRFPTKFTRRANFALTFSVIALSAFFLPACSDDVEPKATAETTDYLPSTTDSPATFTTLRTCVLGDSYPKSADAFLKRISNQTATLDDATVTAVFTDKVARSFNDDAISKLIALYLRGGNVVYVEPTKEGVTQWMTHVKNVYNAMAQKGSLPANYPELATAFYSRFMSETDNADGVPASPFIDGDDTDGVICDMLALRGSDLYVVSDLDDSKKGKTLLEEIDETTGETLSATTADATDVDAATDHLYGQHAELLVAWLNSQPDYMTDKDALIKKGKRELATKDGIDRSKLDEIIDAQKYTRTFNVSYKKRSEPVTLQYEIWNAHDTNDKSDYYLVKETVTLANSKLKCGPEEENMWWTPGYTYGPYMYQFSTAHSFSDRAVKIQQSAPVNSISGSSTYTHGFDWSLNAALTFAKDPSFGVGGGVTFSKSWSYDIPDLGMTYSQNGNAPKWQYTAGTRPTSHYGMKYITHTNAKPILRTDCVVSHSWIWTMPSARGFYSFTTDAEVSIQFLYFTEGFLKTHPKYDTFTQTNRQTFQLAPPPRHVQEWLMSYTPYSNEVQTMLEKQFPKYWKLAFDLPVVELNDRTMIDNRIATLQNLLQNNRSTLHDKGIDNLKISWKLLSSPNVYCSYEYKY